MHNSEIERKESHLSSSLRKIGENIQARKFPLALSQIDQALSEFQGADRFRVLSMAGDCEFKRGRFSEAVRIQLQTGGGSLEDASLWLRPYVGQVRALLKVPDVQQAVIMARHAVALAEAKMADFDENARVSKQKLQTDGLVAVPPLPPRVSVVATRMGNLFLQEGEPEIAEEFFNKAIQCAKGGANRARQGMASIAYARGEYGQALDWASNAIRLGGYKMKTLPAWSTLIAARRQLGGWKISERLINGLDAAPAGLRARTILTIVRELRKNDMRQWREVAVRWIAREGRQYPKYEKEIRKLMLASAKLNQENDAARRQAADDLLQMRVLGPKDWLMGAKELVRSSLMAGQAIDVNALVEAAAEKYGRHFAPRAAHSLALSCADANQHALALPLLENNIQQCRRGSPLWCKSVWARARMKSRLGDHVDAASGYRTFFEAPSVPKRFSLQAQLLWLKELIASGNAGAILEAQNSINTAIGGIRDAEVLMNFGRQLQFGPSELRDFGRGVFFRGESLALEQFGSATNPEIAVDVLYKVTRRQVIDFGQSEKAIELWESLDDNKRDWLWSAGAFYWQYMGCIFEAYVRAGRFGDGEDFAKGLLEDVATPDSGAPFVGVPLARKYIPRRRTAEAISIFNKLAQRAPGHSQCAWAWYWLSVDAMRNGSSKLSKEYAKRIRMAQGSRVGTLEQCQLDAKALLLIADCDVELVARKHLAYNSEMLNRLARQIRADMGRLA